MGIIEQRAMLEGELDRRAADLVARAAEEAQHDVPAGDRVEDEIRIAGIALLKPGRRIALVQPPIPMQRC
ncbi:hypothetical protein [Pelomonas cellulosilytica]|uniref:Uncharacterized protein n=1 Tax=Pelomonas cellulosilytica TaxID=2906762 RepID=A0ABS8XV60_9BURK|nr:hypothetical protein [Pelomonas sp. P8]MCE4556547.1 hypothetical protein [Pelomonas sp. P8]